ncbi:MAG TPA: hypothetical protein VHD60_02495 [Candidatus Saccharimonadales bacterium]|nr:hypothetical protein [Candidatus Saccharimonadales bacterium]
MNVFSTAGHAVYALHSQLHTTNPPAKCDLKNTIATPVNHLVGELEGVAPYVASIIGIVAFVGIIILAASKHASTMLRIVGIVILGVIGVGVIGSVIGVFSTSSC